MATTATNAKAEQRARAELEQKLHKLAEKATPAAIREARRILESSIIE